MSILTGLVVRLHSLAARYIHMHDVGSKALNVLRVLEVDHIARLLLVLLLASDLCYLIIVARHSTVHYEVLIRATPICIVSLINKAVSWVLMTVHGLTEGASALCRITSHTALILAE